MQFFIKSADASGDERLLKPALPSGQFDLMDWSRDGHWLAFHGHAPPPERYQVYTYSNNAMKPKSMCNCWWQWNSVRPGLSATKSTSIS